MSGSVAPRLPYYKDGLIGATPIHIACAIARRFKGEEPTVEWLIDRLGMSQATAYRWRKAWRESNGVWT